MRRIHPSRTPLPLLALTLFLVNCSHTDVVITVGPAVGGVAGYYMTAPPEDPNESRLGNAWGNIGLGAALGLAASMAGLMISEGDFEGATTLIEGVGETLAPPSRTPDPPSTTPSTAASMPSSLEDRTHCVLLETSGPRPSSPGYQTFGWTFTNSCVDAVTIIYRERFADDDRWAPAGTLDMDPGERADYPGYGTWAEEDGGPVVPRPLVVYCAASEPSADVSGNYRALQACVDAKR